MSGIHKFILFLVAGVSFKSIIFTEAVDADVRDLTDVRYTSHGTWHYAELWDLDNSQGWYKMPVGNWQIPYKSQIYDVCLTYTYIVYLTEDLPTRLGEEEKEIQACIINEMSSPDCIVDVTVKIRIYDERIQYYLPYAPWQHLWTPYCFVASDHEFLPSGLVVKVIPELKYKTESIGEVKVNTPYVQFNCVPQVNETMSYKVNWYVEDILIKQLEPTEDPEDLALLESDIETTSLGFEVQCGVIIVNESSVSNETRSNKFFAGLKVVENEITVSKGGFATVEVEQTVPMGCNDPDSSACNVDLNLFDPNLSQNPCDAGISAVNADDDDMCANVIKQPDAWVSQTYKFHISTIDRNYEDGTDFDLQLELGNNVGHSIWKGKVKRDINVHVSDDSNYQNKVCYSHVDPHMRTADGNYYENQEEGYYMLYRHKTNKVEVQEATKYCFGGGRGPVCTCGLLVRAGGDLFMINRCGKINYLDFVRCDDGGIIQVEKINDFKYKITTPIGTQVVITLHGGRYQNTMNVDIIMSAKDFGKTEGLCGNFDGNPSNDFVRKDGGTSNNNADYVFSDSWRLPDQGNLFTFARRILERWADLNEVTCRCNEGVCTIQRRRECGRTQQSITKTKCEIHNRKKRAIGQYNHQKEIDRLYQLMQTPRKIVMKRSAEDVNITAEEATSHCSQSVYNAPAVKEFSNKTANEDPDEVVNQCVFDVQASGDLSWADVHVQSVNDIAKNILDLTPVYVANNTDEVKVFLQQTCTGNCSGNGICLETGECNCSSFYRGPDCSFDIRDPVVIEDIQGGGECDTANETDCSCLTVRTDHIFDGFYCRISLSRMHNESQESVLVDQATDKGEYEDIFTGTCCVPEEGRNHMEDAKAFVYQYRISLSNDGNNFGEPQSVFVYDTTCHNIYINGTSADISLKDGFCFIDNKCATDGELSFKGCTMCNSSVNVFNWTAYNQCENGGSCTFEDNVYACVCADGFHGDICEEDIDECSSNPCLNNGTCTDAINGYICNCTDGFENPNCGIDIDECQSNPCQDGGSCIDEISGFLCNCTPGFNGTLCEINIDECTSHPCQNGGTCVDQVNKYNCNCVAGYEGIHCENETDECASSPCQNGASCEDEFNGFTCTCLIGFEGSNCEIDIDECLSTPCKNGGNCTDHVNGYNCTCADGFEGIECETDTDECVSSPCQNSGTCNDQVNGYFCACHEGYGGPLCENDIDECLSEPCQNGGNCTDVVNGYQCTCIDGFEGIVCETDINECESSPCQNGGTCNDQVNGYLCACQEGYSGVLCENDIDECLSEPCKNGGNCTDDVNGYKCTCADGFEGIVCETDINECESSPCQNGGTCNDQVNGYTCECQKGYNGLLCENDINECVSNPCQNGGTCNDQVNGYTCACQEGYSGLLCENDVDECLSEPCKNGGNCTDDVNGYKCTCADGFEGTVCETDINECESSPCQNGGICNDNVNGYSCACPEGYSGLLCENDIDECLSEPCKNGGNCTDDVNEYKCTCADGFQGLECETDINECASSPCKNGSTCDDQVSGFSCECQEGYDGLLCENDINECESNPCQNGGTCNDKVNGFSCACQEGYFGLVCSKDTDECLSKPCQNGGSCSDDVNGYKCTCTDGYEGSVCETDINECESSPCQNGGTCSDQVNGYLCQCQEGYNGLLCENDINECESSPCQNGGTCIDKVNGFSCECPEGYNDLLCENDIDECLSEPCKNGGNCTDDVNGYKCTCADGFEGIVCEKNINECESSPCQNGGTCNDQVNGYLCQCQEGYNGRLCENDINECESSPCQNGGTCSDKVNGFSCECPEGYNGLLCEYDIDECLSEPCKNGGNCTDDVNGYKCTCADGFEGIVCETDINECESSPCQNGSTCNDQVNGYLCQCQEGYNGLLCENDINECESSPCKNGGTCIDKVNGFSCDCQEGYNGLQCENDIDECLSEPCKNGGNCTDDVNGYKCTCADGFEGIVCETDINECESSPCQNGGTCNDQVNGYLCQCQEGYNGLLCENDINECESSPCQNGGTCIDKVNGFSCECPEGYNGLLCENDKNECVSSPCKNGGTCKDQVNGYSCECQEGYNGLLCENDIDECLSEPCKNGGNCTDDVNGFKCTCADGFEGIVCETDINECEFSPCQNDGTCNDQINGFTCTCSVGYSGLLCQNVITTTSTTATSALLTRTPVQIVFPINIDGINISDVSIQEDVRKELTQFFINAVGTSFRRVLDLKLRAGSMIVIFVAEYNADEKTSSDFAKTNKELLTGEKTVILINKTVSAESITILNTTVTAETVRRDDMICELFQAIYGECPTDYKCSLNNNSATCVKEDTTLGLPFVITIAICLLVTFVTVTFIVTFSIRGYRLRMKLADHHHNEHKHQVYRDSQNRYIWPFRSGTRAWSQQNRYQGPFWYNRDSNSGSWHQSYCRENRTLTTDISRQDYRHQPPSHAQY